MVKRSIYVVLVVALLGTCVPTYAADSGWSPAGIMERLEGLARGAWSSVAKGIGIDIDAGGEPADLERIGVSQRIGIDTEPVGSSIPSESPPPVGPGDSSEP